MQGAARSRHDPPVTCNGLLSSRADVLGGIVYTSFDISFDQELMDGLRNGDAIAVRRYEEHLRPCLLATARRVAPDLADQVLAEEVVS